MEVSERRNNLLNLFTFDQIKNCIEEVKPTILNLWGLHFSDQQMKILLSLCKSITVLAIDFSFNHDPSLPVELAQLTQLKELSLNRYPSKLSFDLSKLAGLEKLTTTGSMAEGVSFVMPLCPNLRTISYMGNRDCLDLTNYPLLEEVSVESEKVVFPVNMPRLKKIVLVTKSLDIVLPRVAPLLEHVEIFEDVEKPRRICWPENAPNLKVKLIDEHAGLIRNKKAP